MTQIGLFYFLGLSLYATGIKFYHFQHYNLFESPADILITLLWLGTSFVLVFSTLRIPYLNPNAKWWTQAPRYAHYRPGVLSVYGHLFPIVTLDISGSGIFLKLDERVEAEKNQREPLQQGSVERRSRDILRNPFLTEQEIEQSKKNLNTYPQKTGEEVSIRVHMIPEAADIFPHQTLEARAEIVWVTKPASLYRYGLGLKFIDPTSAQHRQLKQYVRLVKRLSDLKQGR